MPQLSLFHMGTPSVLPLTAGSIHPKWSRCARRMQGSGATIPGGRLGGDDEGQRVRQPPSHDSEV